MVPRISLLLLLANSVVVLAQPLYKWVEPDGSITFSPQPPASGIDYEQVKTSGAGTSSLKTPRIDVLESAPQVAVGAISTDGNSAEWVSKRSPVSPVAPQPRIQYAPGNSADLPPAISQVNATAGSGVSRRPVSGTLTASQPIDSGESADGLAASISAANFKQNRCQDLKKRVTSLEQRLRSRLTPEDMDNTVIHMARYQRSFDQYCAQ